MKTRSFTLIELLIVLVIIGIVAILAIPQYEMVREKAIATEALKVMDQIKDAESVYKAEAGTYMSCGPIISLLGIEIPESKYWFYEAYANNETSFSIIAIRKGTGGAGIIQGSLDNIVAVRIGVPSGDAITLQYDEATGVRWWGNHPGVPKNY